MNSFTVRTVAEHYKLTNRPQRQRN